MEEYILPSAEHPQLALLDSWLEIEKTSNANSPPYGHLLLRQREEVDSAVWDELFKYIDHAHEGARQSLRAPLGDSLHPLQHNTEVDPAFGYPHKFGDKALKGFFGEIVAGIVAKYFVSDNMHEWEVPVYLFRTHIVAFEQLELMKQTKNWKRQIVGRSGDDGLAFSRDENGHIIEWLACEAKCTGTHDLELIKDNLVKLSQTITRPVDLLRLINALNDYCDDNFCQDWIKALRQFYWETLKNPPVKRCDFSMYICGTFPKRNSTWIPTDKPLNNYTGERSLVCAEFHLTNVEDIIRSLYNRMDNSS